MKDKERKRERGGGREGMCKDKVLLRIIFPILGFGPTRKHDERWTIYNLTATNHLSWIFKKEIFAYRHFYISETS